MHYALEKVESHHSGRILKLFKAIEHLFDAWMGNRVSILIQEAMALLHNQRHSQYHTLTNTPKHHHRYVLRAARARTIAEYIAARRQTILRTIVDRPISEECRGAERQRGSPPRLYWLEQEVEEELSSEEGEEEEDVLAG